MKWRKLLLAILFFINSFFLAGCWNYREVERLAIVAGVAIDRGKNNKFLITTEIVKISGGAESKTTPIYITMEGNSIFDAVRNQISIAGKKLYWSHTKVVIISKDIAKQEMLNVMDWYNRDSETRSDVNILISKEKTAKEVLERKGLFEEINSFEMADMLKNEISLSKAPVTELWEFINDLESPGIANIVPAVRLKKNKNTYTSQILGAAIFKKAKLLGFLNGAETKDALFVRDEIKGGLLLDSEKTNGKSTPISLEIFKSHTKVVPIIKDHMISFNININMVVGIDEIVGRQEFSEKPDLIKFQKSIEKKVEKQIESCITKVQKQYGVDIFGFGATLREEKPKQWNIVGKNWEDKFKDLKINVQTKVEIRGSGLSSKPIKMGD